MPWLLVVVAALIGAWLPEVSSAESANSVGTATVVSGPVTVTRSAVARQPLKLGDAVYWGDVVEVPRGGFARLLLWRGTTVSVRELSRLELRREVRADGMRYALELLWGRLRVSVARMLMRQGEHVDVQTRNAVASARGTDFVVETLELPGQAQMFGLLGGGAVGQGAWVDGARSMETAVTTLSGVVELSNRPPGIGRTQRVGASETSGVRGRQDPVRLHMRVEGLK
jgi:hypothetical protein